MQCVTALISKVSRKRSNDGAAVGGLLMVYERQQDYLAAELLLQNWVATHPNDQQASERLRHFTKLAHQDSLP